MVPANNPPPGRSSAITVLGLIVAVLLLISGYTSWKFHQATQPGPAGAEATNALLKAADAVADVGALRFNISRITPQLLTAEVSTQIRNKLPVGLRLDSVRYVVALDGDSLVRGHERRSQELIASGTSTLRIPIRAALQPLLRKVLARQRDSATLAIRATLYPDLPKLREQGVAVTLRRRVRIPKLPHIDVAGVKLDGLGKNGRVLVTLRVTNYEPLPLRFNTLRYRFRLDPDGDDVDVDAHGTQNLNLNLQKPGEQLVEVPVELNHAKLGKAAFKFLVRARQTAYVVDGTMQATLLEPTPGEFPMAFTARGTLADAKAFLKHNR